MDENFIPPDSRQVKAEHYEFKKYIYNGRWFSFYHQIMEALSIKFDSLLEVGVGSGVVGTILKKFGYPYESMDIDPELYPDHIGSVLEMPFPDKKYDIAVCFQVLEHLPYEKLAAALGELFRVTRRAVILSLPDAESVIQIHIPIVCRKKLIKRPFVKKERHIFNGEHYWEINKEGYEINAVKKDMKDESEKNNFFLENEYRIWENPDHHFFIFKHKNNRQYF